METSIRRAIEEGYYLKSNAPQLSEIREDPLFWQALGKACGWRHTTSTGKTTPSHKHCYPTCQWLNNWHRFIDHLSSGGDAESFFNELLK